MTTLQFCTTATRRQLARVRVLGDTIRRHHPESTFSILLVDDHDRTVGPEPAPLRLLWNEEIGLDPEEIHRLLLIHGPLFPNAIKPFLLEHIVLETGSPVLFLDSAIRLYGPLHDVGQAIADCGVVLTPHALSPYPLDGLGPDDTTILSAGTFNCGMIGVGPKGAAFLEFLESRLRRECIIDVQKMRVGEQRWLDLAPSYFPVLVLRDPGVNVAYWNLHERPLTLVDGHTYAGGVPLRAFNFDGYEADHPDLLSRHEGARSRVTFEREPFVSPLFAAYRAALIAHGEERARTISPAFDALPGGIPVDDTLRTVFRAAVAGAEKQGVAYPPDPFDLSQRPLFVKWCELTYRRAGLPVPDWSSAAKRGEEQPSAVATPVREPVPAEDDAAELLRRLAASSCDAIANLDGRLSALERQLGQFAPVE